VKLSKSKKFNHLNWWN